MAQGGRKLGIDFRAIAAVCLLAGSVGAAAPQGAPVPLQFPLTTEPPAAPPGAAQPAYTIKSTTHLVLTDVVVTDANGRPVHGLPRSAFRILDNRQPQALVSFEEHAGSEADTARTAPPIAPSRDTFSNDFLADPPPVSNVVMIDTTNLAVVDQMYLSEQLERLLQTLPAGEALAVYMRSGSFALLLQNFTADHALLARAFARAVPQLPNVDAREANDYTTLHQMAAYLVQLSGRKNILWFSGGSNLALSEDPSSLRGIASLRAVYDELEAERISLYPIDARGLAGGGAGFSGDRQRRSRGDQSTNQIALNTLRTPRGGETRPFGVQRRQTSLMEQEAAATGGRAFFDSNGITDFAAQIVAESGDFYTLTYAPRDLKLDGKWHKVDVVLDAGPYTLEYRRGYFDDGANLPAHTRAPATRLGGDKDPAQEPNPRLPPILFQIHAGLLSEATADPMKRVPRGEHDAGPRSGTAYLVEYTLPAAAFAQRVETDGQTRVLVGTGIVAFNKSGRLLTKLGKEISLTVDPAKLAAHPGGVLRFDVEVDLPHGEHSLLVSAWDRTTGRIGTIQLQLTVKKQAPGALP